MSDRIAVMHGGAGRSRRSTVRRPRRKRLLELALGHVPDGMVAA